MNVSTQAPSGSALGLARTLWGRRKWLALLVFATVFMATVSLVLGLPTLYRATTVVLVQQEQLLPSFTRSSMSGEVEQRLQGISQEILSRSRLQDLITRFDLYPTLRKSADPEAVIERMRRDIRLEPKESDTRSERSAMIAFTLSYQGWDPQTVVQVTNTLAAFYVGENESLRKRLAANMAANTSAGVSTTVDLAAKLKRELAELRVRFSDNYPDVVWLKAEIAALEHHRQRTARAATDKPRTDTRIQSTADKLEALKFEESRLQAAIAAHPRDGEDVSAPGLDLQRLTREYAAVREMRSSLLKRQEQERSTNALGHNAGAQFRILDSAISANKSVAPDRIRLILMGFVAALVLAVGAVFLAERLDTSFHGVDELRAFTRVPVLASIPRIVTRGDTWRRRLRTGAGAVLAGVGLILVVRVSHDLGHVGEQLVWMLAQRSA